MIFLGGHPKQSAAGNIIQHLIKWKTLSAKRCYFITFFETLMKGTALDRASKILTLIKLSGVYFATNRTISNALYDGEPI